MPSLALTAIGILIVPPLVVEVLDVVGPHPTPVRWVAVVALVIGGVGVVFRFRTGGIQPARHQKLDEARQQRFNAGLVITAALTTSCFAMLIAESNQGVTIVASGVAIAWCLLWAPAWMRRVGTRSSVVIGRDPITVFTFLADLRNGPRFMSEIESVEKITDGPIGRGTQFRSRVLSSNTVFEGVEEIVDYQPPKKIASRVVTGLRPNVDVLQFDAAPEGTQVRHVSDVELPYASAVIGQGLIRPLMTARVKSRRKAAWARLKQLLESQNDT